MKHHFCYILMNLSLATLTNCNTGPYSEPANATDVTTLVSGKRQPSALSTETPGASIKPDSGTKHTNLETVKIGEQTWMRKNLNVSTFKNGELIPVFRNHAELAKLSSAEKPATGDYDNDTTSSEKLGKLYNWYAVNDKRELCPEGFRIPKTDDYIKLFDHVNVTKHETEDLEKALEKSGSSGFGTQYGGWCCMDYVDYEYDPGTVIDFFDAGSNAALWTSTECQDEDGCSMNVDIGITARSDSMGVYIDESFRGWAFSVRCIKE